MLRQGLRPRAEDLQPAPARPPDEAHEPAQGARPRPAVRPDLVGRGARPRGGEARRGPREGIARRSRLPESRRELRRRRHADLLHGDVPGVPCRVGPDRLQLRQRAGRQVLPLGASLRGAVASRVHRLPGHADVGVRAFLRREHRSVGRRRRRVAPRRGARARPEAGADRAASLDHRCRVRRVGADPAEDRRGVPVRPDPRPPAPRAAGTARPPVPQGANRLAVPDRSERLLPARPGDAQAARLGPRRATRRPVRHGRRRRRARGPLHGRRGRDRRRRRDLDPHAGDGGDGLHRARRAHGRVHARVGRARVRHPAGHGAPHRGRVPRARARRRDDGDRRRRAAAAAGRDRAREDGDERLGRLRMLLGADARRVPRRRARSAGRDARDDRAAEPPRHPAAGERQAGAGRVHGLPDESDRPRALGGGATRPERVLDARAALGELAVVERARADASRVDVPQGDAGRTGPP